jgi:hypothetical protein
MKRYQPAPVHPGFRIAAVAMTAITIVLTVIVPARMEVDGRDGATLSASKAEQTPIMEVAISPARIDIVAVREQTTAFQPALYPVLYPVSARKRAG